MIKDVADQLFRDENETDGNFSKSLDHLLNMLRNKTDFAYFLKLISYKNRYDKGERSKEVLDAMRKYTMLINSVT